MDLTWKMKICYKFLYFFKPITFFFKTKMRFYENKYPEVDDCVIVKVQNIEEMGAYVSLLEYDNIEGMIQFTELTRRFF